MTNEEDGMDGMRIVASQAQVGTEGKERRGRLEWMLELSLEKKGERRSTVNVPRNEECECEWEWAVEEDLFEKRQEKERRREKRREEKV